MAKSGKKGKKKEPESRLGGGSSRAGHPSVMSSKGRRQHFLRGMITHDLVQRGVDFDQAYSIASGIRDRVRDREEVTTDEIRDLIQEELEKQFGRELPEAPPMPVEATDELQVLHHGHRQPFSRGVLARSMVAAGVDLDRAYALINEFRAQLREESLSVLPSPELARRIAELLEEREGKVAARRYQLVRQIHQMPRPLVIYIGGASGTGKSTLALELAPLLRIYRISATDTIRQVMRMVFSPSMLPALHGSSFEVTEPFGAELDAPRSPNDPEFLRRLHDSFSEQVTRVLVGVRAVVDRAIAENMSIVVEGVHLYPPLVPFKDLAGAVHQVALVLGTLDEEAHRARFLARARLGGRRAERYLENFGSIRAIHDLLLHQAESQDVPLIDTSDPDPVVGQSLRWITAMLERSLPRSETMAGEPRRRIPTLLLIIDGLADRPVRALGGRTPLQAAETPALDRLAREGRSGLADPISPGVVPDTAAGTLAIFGQSPLALKRGPVEALGAGIALSPADVALRGNFATLDDKGFIVDRRAGRIREDTAELARSLDRLALPGSLSEEIEIRVKAATEHRLAIVLRGHGLSSAIQGSDPGDGAAMGPPLTPRPDDPSDLHAAYTAQVLALFEQEARKVLETHEINRRRRASGLAAANAILTRGAGRIHRLVPLEEAGFPLRLACVAADHTILGLASLLGAQTITSDGMTANLDTNLEAKFAAAKRALEDNDLVVLHLKGADIAAHDQRPDLKVKFLERTDLHLAAFLAEAGEDLRVVVASDHATLSESGQHGADPLPIVLWGSGVEPDEVDRFDEPSAAAGALQRFPLQMLLGRLYELG